MSQVRVNESSLTNIANAIRDKNHEVTKYKPSEMPAAISRIKTNPVLDKLTVTENGKYTPPAEIDGYNEVDVAVEGVPTDAELTISGDCVYRFMNGGWDWFIEKYGNRITTNNITRSDRMFSNSNVSIIPFDLNFSQHVSNHQCGNTFSGCKNLTSVPKINNCNPSTLVSFFSDCERLRYLPDDIATGFDWSYLDNLTSQSSGNTSNLFSSCYSLRSVPMDFLAHGNPVATNTISIYSNAFQNCYVLDELVNLPNPHYNATWPSNAFRNSFKYCSRLKNLTFALNPETNAPYVVKWKSQIIDLTTYVGYAEGSASNIVSYNSGITADKEVTDDATYQALKNDPDWFTTNIAYSRYNHDSAVATINSLPDTSAYIAQKKGTNTIKFQGASGSSTDGGAINTLTEAEIAVASAKGWTVNIT